MAAERCGDNRANTVAVAAGSNEVHAEPVAHWLGFVMQQERAALAVHNKRIYAPVIVEITDGKPPAHQRTREIRPRPLADVLELGGTAAPVVKQEKFLAIRRAGFYGLNVVLNMPVGNNQIQQAVVVEIEQLAAERYVIHRDGRYSGQVSGVAERAPAIVMIQGFRFPPKCRHEQIELSVVIVIAPIRAHAAVNVAVPIPRHARRRRAVDVPDCARRFARAAIFNRRKQIPEHLIIGDCQRGGHGSLQGNKGRAQSAPMRGREVERLILLAKTARAQVAVKRPQQRLVVRGAAGGLKPPRLAKLINSGFRPKPRVIGNKQIQLARPRNRFRPRARRPPRLRLQPRLPRHILENAGVQVFRCSGVQVRSMRYIACIVLNT